MSAFLSSHLPNLLFAQHWIGTILARVGKRTSTAAHRLRTKLQSILWSSCGGKPTEPKTNESNFKNGAQTGGKKHTHPHITTVFPCTHLGASKVPSLSWKFNELCHPLLQEESSAHLKLTFDFGGIGELWMVGKVSFPGGGTLFVSFWAISVCDKGVGGCLEWLQHSGCVLFAFCNVDFGYPHKDRLMFLCYTLVVPFRFLLCLRID